LEKVLLVRRNISCDQCFF